MRSEEVVSVGSEDGALNELSTSHLREVFYTHFWLPTRLERR